MIKAFHVNYGVDFHVDCAKWSLGNCFITSTQVLTALMFFWVCGKLHYQAFNQLTKYTVILEEEVIESE